MARPQDEPRGSDAESPTRRRVLRGIAAGAASVGAVSVGATAQSDDDETTPVAAPNTAPTFGRDDYVGLFVQISGYARDVDRQGVRGCGFAGSEESLTSFDAQFVNPFAQEVQSEPTVVHAVTGGEDVKPGKLFVVNRQSSCPGGYTSLELEQVGSSTIDFDRPDQSSSPIPGFGPVAAITGVGLAALGALRKRNER